jgi:hypothetical protein
MIDQRHDQSHIVIVFSDLVPQEMDTLEVFKHSVNFPRKGSLVGAVHEVEKLS